MSKKNQKKISAFLPADLLAEAMASTELNQTDTIISALKELVAKQERIKALKNLGKIHIDFDVEQSRQRKTV